MTETPVPPPSREQPPDGYAAYPPPPLPGSATGLYAPWWKRAVAAVLDLLLIAVPFAIFGSVSGMIEVVRSTDGELVRYTTDPVLSVLTLLATLAYSAVMEGSERKATVGKMALNIEVRDAGTGASIGPGRAALRRLVYLALFYALFIPGAINALSPLWDARRQAWHDKAVNSVVVNSGSNLEDGGTHG